MKIAEFVYQLLSLELMRQQSEVILERVLQRRLATSETSSRKRNKEL